MIYEQPVYRVTFKYREPIGAEDANVQEIRYHESRGDGDGHYIDVILKSGDAVRYFKPLTIHFYSDTEVEK